MQAVYPRPLGPYVLVAELESGEDETTSLAIAGTVYEERLLRVSHAPLVVSELEVTSVGEPSANKTGDEGRASEGELGELRTRFAARWTRWRGLSHPALLRFRDAGEEEGEIFAAFDHVVGRSLTDLTRLAKREGLPLPRSVAFFVAREVVAALAYLHGAEGGGLVHGDVCADRILISFSGEVKLCGGTFSRLANVDEPTDKRVDVRTWASMLHELLGVCPPPPPEDSNLGELWTVLSAEEKALPAAPVWQELLDRVLASQPGAQGELAALMLLFPEDREREARVRAVDEGRPLLVPPEPILTPGGHGAHSSPTVQINLLGSAAATDEEAIPRPIPPRRTPWSDDEKMTFRTPERSTREPPAFAAGELAFFSAHKSGVMPGAALGNAGARPSRDKQATSGEVRVRSSTRQSLALRKEPPTPKKRRRVLAAWLGVGTAGVLSFALIWWLQPLHPKRSSVEGGEGSASKPVATSAPAPSAPSLVASAPEEPSAGVAAAETAAPSAPAEALPAESSPADPVAEGARIPQSHKPSASSSNRPARAAAPSSTLTATATAPVTRGAEVESLGAVLSRARFAYVNEDFDDAISGARQALTMGAGAEAHSLLGNAYLGKHFYRDAEREYVRALALEPRDMHSKDRLEWLRARKQVPSASAPLPPTGQLRNARAVGP